MKRSDHNIILFKIELNFVEQETVTRRYDTKHVNWCDFNERYIAEIRNKYILSNIKLLRS